MQEEISALLMDTLLDTYYSGIGYVATLKLRIFDFALLPKSAAYQRLLRCGHVLLIVTRCDQVPGWAVTRSMFYKRQPI